jgi:hypothetical protein
MDGCVDNCAYYYHNHGVSWVMVMELWTISTSAHSVRQGTRDSSGRIHKIGILTLMSVAVPTNLGSLVFQSRRNKKGIYIRIINR